MRVATRQKLIPRIAGVLLTAVALWLPTAGDGPLTQLIQRLEGVAYDVRLSATLRKAGAPDPRIVIVTIDEKSLAAEGRWPWPRDRMAEMNQVIFSHNAAVVGYDVLFTEAEANSVATVMSRLPQTDAASPALLTELSRLAPLFDHDDAFARSMAERDVVLGYTFHTQASAPSGRLPPPIATRTTLDWDIGTIKAMRSYTANLSSLQDAARGSAFLTTLPDPDGVLRRTPLLLRYGDALYASLALEMAKAFFLLDDIGINTALVGAERVPESISLGSVTVPIDVYGQVIVPYRGKSPAFPYISASDVLRGDFAEDFFENKIVLVGASALGLGDVVTTPVQSLYPGVEVHASILAGILDQRFPVNPSWAPGANFAVTATAGLAATLLMPAMSAIGLLLLGAASITGLVLANGWMWQEHNAALHIATPLALIGALMVLNLTHGFLRETQQRGQLKNMFGQYVPPQLVEIMMRNPEDFNAEGESREMTVLFADIRGFTTLSETLHPTELKRLLNQFFGHMTRIIFDHHGTIDKYVGDMIMAFWGAPVRDAHHGLHGVQAALAMLATVEKIRPQLQAQGLPDIHIGIGLNTGLMHVGDMGSEYRRAYTVLGDAVNLASRLEGLTKYYGVGVVIGEQTRAQLGDFVCRKLDRVKVKGKTRGIEVYEPLCARAELPAAMAAMLDEYHRALDLYWGQQWDAAAQILTQLHNRDPHSAIYALYLERIASLRNAALPADWDGVYERRSK